MASERPGAVTPETTQPAAPRGDLAVVVGGSIAGTLAARVLSESYRRVLVVDRDKILGVAAPRRGAPHAVHAHGLHARGYLILAELFPGLLEEAGQLPGLTVRDFGGMRWYFDGRPIRPADTGLRSIAGSRPVLENYLRSRVAALPNVTYRESTELESLCWSDDGSRVTGVRLRPHGDTPTEEIRADLVVDATGRGSRTPAWLAERGYQRPAEERMRIGLAYTTKSFRRRPGTFDKPQAINPVASPAHPRGAFFGQAATGDCRVSLTGINGDHPPTDPEGFLAYTRTLPAAEVYEAIRDAEPTSDAVSFTFPASVWRHYERLTAFPGGLVVVGDAIASFNPVYGQGMTVAALEADVLRRQLRRGAPDPLRLLGGFARAIRDPWRISTWGDLDFASVPGRRTWRVRLFNAYIARVQYAATRDATVTAALMRVNGLVDRPAALFRPALLTRVLRLSRG